jgi:predicted DNA-binding protein (MmcQ/YjbR family)
MSLFEKKQFENFLSERPGVSFVDQWESRVAKVGGKVFTLLSAGSSESQARIVFKVAEESFEILTALDGISQAPYFAKRQWVSVAADADLPDADLKIYIDRSYKIIARGLTKKLRMELGINLD